MFSKYNSFIDIAEREIFSIKAATEMQKIKLREQWKETKTMPRKMKKQRRKEIILDWKILTYDPFGLNKVDMNVLHDVMNLFREKLYGK